jgi:hypothetical protein
MKIFSKAALLIATAATVASATPAMARDHYRDHDGISAGDVIAGALIIGGIAAIASAGSRDRYYDNGRRYYDNGYYRGRDYYSDGYDSRYAVDQCVRAAQRDAGRYGWARVTDVTRIDRVYGGYEVRGRVVVQDRDYRSGWGRSWDRGYYYDRYNDGYDKGKFTCISRYGRVDQLRLSGLNYY